MFILSFGFISCSKFSKSISPVDHYSFSSVLQSFPNLFVHVIIWFHQFFPPISGKYGKIHNFSWENMERSTIFHGKIWKDPPFSMGKYGQIHHFSWENMERSTIFMGKYGQIHHFSWENMDRSTIFHGKIWKDPPFFMGNSFTAHMKNFLSVIFWSFWNEKPSESKCSDIFSFWDLYPECIRVLQYPSPYVIQQQVFRYLKR